MNFQNRRFFTAGVIRPILQTEQFIALAALRVSAPFFNFSHTSPANGMRPHCSGIHASVIRGKPKQNHNKGKFGMTATKAAKQEFGAPGEVRNDEHEIAKTLKLKEPRPEARRRAYEKNAKAVPKRFNGETPGRR